MIYNDKNKLAPYMFSKALCNALGKACRQQQPVRAKNNENGKTQRQQLQ